MAAAVVLALQGLRVTRAAGFSLQIDALDIRQGEVFAAIGPNGAGKSTLLRVLGLLEPPQAGQVLLHGRAVDARRALTERRRMAAVFQQPLLAEGTVAHNVGLGLRFRGIAARAAAPRIAAWLERFGIAALAGRAARTLSGGEAQRVALARALVLEPEVLLLDEPFSGLDAPTRAGLVADLGVVLRDTRVTTVIVTHERGETLALADRVAVLMAGRVRQLDDTARVFYAPADEEIARFVGVETLVTGRVVAGEAGLTTVEVNGRRVDVGAVAPIGTTVRLGIRPEDVTLEAGGETRARTSARNALPGVVSRVTPSPHATLVTVEVGFPLVAAVTARSALELGLGPGVRVCAIFKASAAQLIPYAGPLDTPEGRGL